MAASPTGGKFPSFGQMLRGATSHRREVLSSSSEAERRPNSSMTNEPRLSRQPSHTLAYSGNERTSLSDFSDTGFRGSTLSLANPSAAATTLYQGARPNVQRNASQLSGIGVAPDEERVICHGWIYILKSKGGVRQWKKIWMVLRPKCLALYKNEDVSSPIWMIWSVLTLPRNTRPIWSSPLRPSSMRSRLIPSPRASDSACSSSLKSATIVSALRMRTPLLNGWVPLKACWPKERKQNFIRPMFLMLLYRPPRPTTRPLHHRRRG
jgi:hypothetical protein